MIEARIAAISPFFAVADVSRTASFYCGKLGFECTFREPEVQPHFAILRRDGAQILIKSQIGVDPLPNCKRHPCLRWDAYLFVSAPDALAAELLHRGAIFSAPLKDTHDGLRGFEATDPDGYVLFFGCPRTEAAR